MSSNAEYKVSGTTESIAPLSSRSAETLAPVSIRVLGPNHRHRLLMHLLSLGPEDRYLRFGYSPGDHQIRVYVDHLDFLNDAVFGVFDRRLEIVAMAHLAISTVESSEPIGEFGVSVAHGYRGRGIGRRLYERSALHARNEGVEVMRIQALADNTAMLSIVRKLGATVHRHGPESEAYIKLPKPDLESRIREILEDYWAHLNYRAKAQNKILQTFLNSFPFLRQRVPVQNEDASI